jgi:DNA-binding transcriptional ArsR family regulator
MAPGTPRTRIPRVTSNMPCAEYALYGIFECMANAAWTALVDPHRRAMLDLIRERPRSVGELVDSLAISQPATSKHLRVLRDCGMVRVQNDAQRRIYAINTGPLEDLDAWLAPYRTLWNDRLDALGEHLDRTHGPSVTKGE